MLEGPGLLQELLPRPRPTRPGEVLLEQTWSLWEDGGLRLPALLGVRRRLWSLSAAKGDRAGSPVLGASPSRTPRLVLSGALTRAAGTAARKATGLETRTRSPRTHTRSVRTLSPTPQGGAARRFALWLFSRSRRWFLSSWELCVLHRGDPGESLGGVSGWIVSGQPPQRSTGMGALDVGSRLSFLGYESAVVRLGVCSPPPGAAAGHLPPGLSTSVSLALFASLIASFSCSWVLSYFALRPLFSGFYIYTERESAGEREEEQRREGLWDSPLSVEPAPGLHPVTLRSWPDESRTLGDGVPQAPHLQPQRLLLLGRPEVSLHGRRGWSCRSSADGFQISAASGRAWSPVPGRSSRSSGLVVAVPEEGACPCAGFHSLGFVLT